MRNLAYLERAASIRCSLAAVCLTVISSLSNNLRISSTVYSSDGKDLGKIASVRKSGTSSKIYFDMGGFLGIGSTRKSVASEQIQDVKNDRVVLSLSESDAQKLPATEDTTQK